jgi:L-lysine 2,3-aminomutase
MKTKILAGYVESLLNEEIENLQTIRIGTKALSYWPNRFLTDDDADDLLRLFEKIVKAGKNLAIMAHFNHPVELSTDEVKEAIRRIRATGAQVRTQSPVMRHINDSPDVWAAMWRQQVNLNCIPYYMFIARDTGAQHYFSVPLVRAWEIFRNAYQQVSGVCRTVRGPSMSATPGKVQVLGVAEINGRQVITLRMLQGRNPDWVARPFFAEYDDKAIWLDELKPAFAEKFFFEEELKNMFSEQIQTSEAKNFE